ncbi:MAG: TonB family protein [Acidobacteriota bacterium]
MIKKIVKISYFLAIFLFILNLSASAQKKERIEVVPTISTETLAGKCKKFTLGTLTLFLQPEYPPEAKTAQIGGTVTVSVSIDETGKVSGIKKVEGTRVLQNAVINAVQKVKFTPTVCDGVPKPVSGLLTYNFIPYIFTETYFKPEKIEDFADIKRDSPFYEAILDLTENYQLAFGYADKNYHADAPLTRGDFAESLRLTLDLLSERAKIINKIPGKIGLFYSYNPQNIISADKIKDIDRKKNPYFDSVKILLEKYQIVLINDSKNFNGNLPLTQNEVIDLWTKIFGAEAIPVNFEKIKTGDRIFTRGEFALFLQESLNVLTYKVLP